jgi:DnaJ-class molecular chaperone
MNLIFDALHSALDAGDRRMDAAGVPKIVRERCPYCAGSGLREIGVGPLAKLDTCHACVGRGYIVAEVAL